MKNFRVVIEEIVSDEFEIFAESKEDAILKSIQKYKSGEFILSSGNIEHKQLAVISEDDDSNVEEWIEF